MKRFKKFMAGVIALAMVLGMVGVMPAVEAKAATAPSVAFDATQHLLTVNEAGANKYVYIGESKNIETAPKTYTVFEAADSAATTIDLSSYAKKNVVLWIYTTTSTSAAITKYEIKKSDIKLKVTLKLDETNIYDRFEVKSGETTFELPPTDGTTPIQFRIDGDPSWQPANENKLKIAIAKIEQYGATIYFRHVGKSLTPAGNIDKTGEDALMFASPEAKVKYPKLGKAPKITVDYVKGLIKFPKAIEVKGIKKDLEDTTADATAWTLFEPTAEKAGAVAINDVKKTNPASEFTFYARVVANGKKPKSSVFPVTVPEAQPTPVVKDNGNEGIVVTLAKKSATDFTYKGISVKNNTADLIEYALVTNGDGFDDKTKWTKLAADAEKVLPVAAGGKDLLIRVAGVKEVTKSGSESAPKRMSAVVTLPLEFEIQNSALTLDSSTSAVTTATYDDKTKAKTALDKIKVATATIKIKTGAISTATAQTILLPIKWDAGSADTSPKFTAILSTPLPAGFAYASGAEASVKVEKTITLKSED